MGPNRCVRSLLAIVLLLVPALVPLPVFVLMIFTSCIQTVVFMLLTMMIPGVLFLIPSYVFLYNLGWVGHYEALIVPSAVGARWM